MRFPSRISGIPFNDNCPDRPGQYANFQVRINPVIAEAIFLLVVLPLFLGACAFWIWMLLEGRARGNPTADPLPAVSATPRLRVVDTARRLGAS